MKNTINDITKYKKGDSYQEERVVCLEDGKTFAEVSQDWNPIHLDDEVAAESRFGQRIVHGMLIGSYFSGIIGNSFPGSGFIYISQDLRFKRPVYYDQKIILRLEIVEIDYERRRMKLSTRCFSNDDVLVDGVANLLYE